MSIMLAAIMCVCMCETNHSVVDASMPYVQLWILSMCVCISVYVCPAMACEIELSVGRQQMKINGASKQ